MEFISHRSARSLSLLAVFLLALAVSGCGINNIPTLEEQAKAKWSDVQNNYQRRADLIPNLVETVKGYAKQEKDVLEAVINARARATQIQVNANTVTDPDTFKKFQEAQSQLSGALGRLIATVENYPDLKSNQNFLALQSQLEGTENRIAIARKDYIEAVRAYNTELRTWPGIIWAKTVYSGNKPMETFTAIPDAQKPPPGEVLDRARCGGCPPSLFVLACVVVAAAAFAQSLTFPALTGRVVDEAGILDAATRDKLEKLSADLEAKSTDQLVVVTLKSLQGTSIEDYGYQLGRHWQIGQKDKNNGVLLIVAPNERKVRIEVGYGLEGTLTDALGSFIIQQAILPRFRAGDFAGGIDPRRRRYRQCADRRRRGIQGAGARRPCRAGIEFLRDCDDRVLAHRRDPDHPQRAGRHAPHLGRGAARPGAPHARLVQKRLLVQPPVAVLVSKWYFTRYI